MKVVVTALAVTAIFQCVHIFWLQHDVRELERRVYSSVPFGAESGVIPEITGRLGTVGPTTDIRDLRSKQLTPPR